MKDYKVGLYLRLSRDDKNSDSMSMSISNQRDMLVDYVEERGWQIENIYIDDGISGATFERPSFKRMIADIEKKRINMVICKDLSRLGRNYVRVGEYTDFFFPRHKVRFIAVNENIDSTKDNDIAGFLNIVNEHYAKDISRKVKAAKHTLMKKGYFLGSQPPMGYVKSPEDKHKLVIDEGSRVIIERIFHLYSIGHTARHIADTFNREGVLSPRGYYFNLIGKPNPYTKETILWGSATIMRMLKNVVYTGHMCQGKRKNRSFKMKERDTVPQEEWILVENTHEAIIDEVTWSRVQGLLKLNKKNQKPKPVNADKTPALFAGKLKCVDCGAVMHYTYSKSGKYKAYYKYRCSTYSNQGKTACSFHSILEDEIKAIVLNDIRKISELAVMSSDEMLSLLLNLNGRTKLKSNVMLESKIKTVNSNLKGVSNKIDVLLEQKISGNISDSMFKKLMIKYEDRQNALNIELSELKAEFSIVKDDTQNIRHLIESFKQRIYIEELDRDTICELIDYITVSKKVKVGKEYKQKVSINYNFVGELKGCDITEFFDHITRYQKETDQTA
ncbi:MAG: recombinase family protein [Clostridia bacterium]|jgi:site-specific DNA recombinase|nr:recombinase family protein [Clostridia bacterium]